MSSILVYDTDTLRCKAWARRLAIVAAPSLEIFTLYEAGATTADQTHGRIKSYSRDKGRFLTEDEPPECYSLVLRHYRDAGVMLFSISSLDVWYGGNGAEPGQGGEWHIWRKLDSQAAVEVITNQELAEFLSWALAASSDRVQRPVPSLLRPPIRDILHSLYVLCQAHLATWAALAANEPENTRTITTTPIAKEALAAFGVWLDFFRRHPEGTVSSALRTTVALEKRYAEASDPTAWRVFDLQTLGSAVEQEWANGPSDGLEKVSELVSWVTGSKPLPLEVVVGAYCALAHRLGADLNPGGGSAAQIGTFSAPD